MLQRTVVLPYRSRAERTLLAGPRLRTQAALKARAGRGPGGSIRVVL